MRRRALLTQLVAAAVAAAGTTPSVGRCNLPLLVIAGASGRTGGAILEAAPADRFRIRALSGDLARARQELGAALYARAQWLQVDVRKATAVRKALSGADYVISAIGARIFEGPSSPQFVDFGGNVNLIDAARAAGTRHFVLVSSASAGSHRDQRLTPRLGNVLLDKTQAEEHLKRSGLGYTIVGPAGLLDTPPRQDGLQIIRRADYGSTNVARGDVARVVLDALVNPDADHKSFALVGDRPGDPDAWRAELRVLPRDAPAVAE